METTGRVIFCFCKLLSNHRFSLIATFWNKLFYYVRVITSEVCIYIIGNILFSFVEDDHFIVTFIKPKDQFCKYKNSLETKHFLLTTKIAKIKQSQHFYKIKQLKFTSTN